MGESGRTAPRVETLRGPIVTGMPSSSPEASSGRRRIGSSYRIYAPAACPVSIPLSISARYRDREGSNTHLVHRAESLEELPRAAAQLRLDNPSQVPPRVGHRLSWRRQISRSERATVRAINHDVDVDSLIFGADAVYSSGSISNAS